ncbi:MAG: Ig-like domain-containing protein [Clostridium sp.]|nr:Ig-like domain-containing protein [Clostridium sp.]
MAFQAGEPIVLPETVSAVFADGSVKEVPVSWNEEQLSAAVAGGAEAYEVEGTAEGRSVKCSFRVDQAGNLLNAGFESADMSMWVLAGTAVSGEGHCERKEQDARTGVASFHFWDSAPLDFQVVQTMTDIENGTYSFSGFLQGDDGGDGAEFYLFAKSGDTEYRADTSLAGFGNWQAPVIEGIEVTDGTLTVGFAVRCGAGGWGGWDDLKLEKTKESQGQ